MDEAFIYGRVIVCEALAECPITLPYMKAESIIREEIYSRKILFVLSDTLNIKKSNFAFEQFTSYSTEGSFTHGPLNKDKTRTELILLYRILEIKKYIFFITVLIINHMVVALTLIQLNQQLAKRNHPSHHIMIGKVKSKAQ